MDEEYWKMNFSIEQESLPELEVAEAEEEFKEVSKPKVDVQVRLS